MSAQTGTDEKPSQDEAIDRIQSLPVDPDDDSSETVEESDRTLQSVIDTGGSTEYAHIYLATITGEYNGNKMLWMRYVWLSKPGAFESDMFGSNGMSMRMVEGMADALPPAVAATCNRLKAGGDHEVVFKNVSDE